MAKQNTTNITDSNFGPYYIVQDEYCYTVMKKIIAEGTGRERETILGHFSRLDTALSGIATDSMVGEDYTSVAEYVAVYEEKVKQIKGIKVNI